MSKPNRNQDGRPVHRYERRKDLDSPDGLALWAVTVAGDTTEDPEEAEDWRDFESAAFERMDETSAELAAELRNTFVTKLLAEAGLSPLRRREAMDMIVIETGTTPRGLRLIQATFPFCGLTSTTEWDGTNEDARGFMSGFLESCVDDIEGDRSMSGPTGWEPEFDPE